MMNAKMLMGWLIATIYSIVAIFGTVKFLEMSVTSKALILIILGVITCIVAIIGLDRFLKKSFFMSGIFMINYALGYSWSDLSSYLKFMGFGFILIEIIYILSVLYKRVSPKMPYTGRTSVLQPSTALFHVDAFCKSKYAGKEEVDSCIAKIMGGK
jgi:hypothetical protein